MIAKFLCALAALCAFASVPAHAVTFETVFPDAAAFSSEERERIRTHVELAGQAWVEVLHVSAPEAVITVEVLLASIPTATGRSLWVGHLGQLGSSQLWEQGMAFELRTGVDDNGADSDVEFVLGASYLRDTLWLPEDPMAGNVPADRVD